MWLFISLDVLWCINSYLTGCEWEKPECKVSKRLVCVVVLHNSVRAMSVSKFETDVVCSDWCIAISLSTSWQLTDRDQILFQFTIHQFYSIRHYRESVADSVLQQLPRKHSMHSLFDTHSVMICHNLPHYPEAFPAEMFMVIHDICRQKAAAVHCNRLLNFASHTFHDQSPIQLL